MAPAVPGHAAETRAFAGGFGEDAGHGASQLVATARAPCMLPPGEAYALLAAVSFTLSSASFAFASRAAGGFATNHFRLLLAVPVLWLLHALGAGQWWPAVADPGQLALLVGSGIVGLVLGDLGYFHALATIGPRLSSVLMASWPLVVVLLDRVLGRSLSWRAAGGMLVLLLGIALVLLRGREGSVWNATMSRRSFWGGVAGALLGAVGQAVGIVMARAGMAAGDGVAAVPPLAATLLRMGAGAVGLQLLALLQRQPLAGLAVVRAPGALRPALVGMLFGPVFGVWLSLLATQQAASTGVAAALMATVPVFMMPVAWWLYGARIGGLGALGTLLVVAGAGLMLVR